MTGFRQSKFNWLYRIPRFLSFFFAFLLSTFQNVGEFWYPMLWNNVHRFKKEKKISEHSGNDQIFNYDYSWEIKWNRYRYNQWDTVFLTMNIYTIIKYELWFYWMRQKIPHQTETRRKIYTIRWINIDSSMSLHISGVSITMRVSCWKSSVARKKIYANLAGHLSDELFDGNKRSVRIFFLPKALQVFVKLVSLSMDSIESSFFHPHF